MLKDGRDGGAGVKRNPWMEASDLSVGSSPPMTFATGLPPVSNPQRLKKVTSTNQTFQTKCWRRPKMAQNSQIGPTYSTIFIENTN